LYFYLAALPPLPPKTRNGSATNKKIVSKQIAQQPKTTRNSSTNNKKIIPEAIEERQPRTRSRSTNNRKSISQPIKEQPKPKVVPKTISEPIKEQPKTKVEPKNTTPAIRTSKRRLQSVDKNEGIKKKVAEEKIPPVQNLELSQEERQKVKLLFVLNVKINFIE
jgi:hypothetical protein